MPEIIRTSLADSPFLVDWYTWGVILAFLFSLAATAWIFADSQRRVVDSTLWKSLAAVAAVLTVPGMLARIHAGFAADMESALATVAILSMLGLLLAAGAAVGHYATASQTGDGGVIADDDWERTNVSGPSSGTDTIPVGAAQYGNDSAAAQTPRKTKFLGAARPLALAWLVIADGQYKGERLDVRANGLTRVGAYSDPNINDWIIDDEAVSSIHLSIRHENGSYTATDLDATNRTRVNGVEINAPTSIKHGDRIRIGQTNLLFVEVSEESLEGKEQVASRW